MSSRWLPIAGSFGVYLTPLVGPHAFWLLGESLVQELTRGPARDPWWTATDVALALAVQAAAWALLAWSLRSPFRLLAWIAAVPALVAGLNTAYLVAIPSYFLIEADTAPELAGWPEHCVAAHVSLVQVRGPVNQPASGVAQSWVQRPDGRYGLLRLPDCAVVDAGLPIPAISSGIAEFSFGLQFVTRDGKATLERSVPRTSQSTWWFYNDPSEGMAMLDRPDLAEGAPILSDTADAVAWMQRVAGSGPPVLERALVRPIRPGSTLPDARVELAPFGAAQYTLLGLDTVAREVLLWRNDQPLVVGFGGEAHESVLLPTRLPAHIRPQATTYLRHRTGWVAWDAYREDGPYQIAWSLAAGSGTHRANRGRAITAAAVNPSGTLVAVSETTTLNIGSASDVVYVIRARDGADVFRRYLPRYARSPVVFLEGGRFGYSDLAGTHVLNSGQ